MQNQSARKDSRAEHRNFSHVRSTVLTIWETRQSIPFVAPYKCICDVFAAKESFVISRSRRDPFQKRTRPKIWVRSAGRQKLGLCQRTEAPLWLRRCSQKQRSKSSGS